MHVQKLMLTFVLLLLVLPAPSLIGIGTLASKETQVTANSYSPAVASRGASVEPTKAVESSGTPSTGWSPSPDSLTLSTASSREAIAMGDQSITPMSASGTITVMGRGMYIDEFGNWFPMRYVYVELWEDDGPEGSDGDYVREWTYTDVYGSFSFPVMNDDPGGTGGRDPYVRIWAIGEWDWFTTGNYPYFVGYYFDLPKLQDNVPDGDIYNYGWRNPPSGINKAWLAGDAAYAEAQWLYDQVGWTPPMIQIKWPSRDWPVFGSSSDQAIHLPAEPFGDNKDQSWNHVTVHHEYGHAVMYYAYGGTLPSGFQTVNPHYPSTQSPNGVTAFVEGWAEFMQAAVDGNRGNLQDVGGDIETNTWFNYDGTGAMDGNIVEGSVASILWDIFDPTDPTDTSTPAYPTVGDNMNWGFDEIFWTLYYDRPYDMFSFYNAWVNYYTDPPTSVGPLATIYWNYGIVITDGFAPWGSIAIDGGNYYTRDSDVFLVISASDYGSGVAWMRFRDDSTQWTDWEWYSRWESWTLSPGDGPKDVAVQFKDWWGNLSPIYWDSIMFDTTPPTGSIFINSYNPTYTTSTSVTLYLTDSDALSGVSAVRYSNDEIWDTETWEPPPYLWAPYGPFFINPWNLLSGDGPKTVYFQVRDMAGLVSPMYNDTIILDTTPPTGSISINGGASYTMFTSVVLSLTFSDATSGVMMVRYSNDLVWDELWEFPPASDPDSRYLKSWSLTSGDGPKIVYYQIMDNAGLVSNFSDGITLDTIAPIGSITINGNATYTTSTSVTLNLWATDQTADGDYFGSIATMGLLWLSNDGFTFWPLPYTFPFTWELSPGDGVKTVYIWFQDRAGNGSPIYKDEITLDTTPPTGSIVINKDAKYTTSRSVTLYLSANDLNGVVGFEISNSGIFIGAIYLFETPFEWTLSLGDGVKTVYVSFEDLAGNVSPAFNDTIILDTTPPTGSININRDDKYTTSTNVTLYLERYDATSGVLQVRYSNDGKWDTEPWEAPSNRKAWNLTYGEGDKTVYYQIIDKVGWLSITYNDTIILTKIIPEVTSFSVKPNPFSPNKDGAKDTTTINATFNVVVNWQLDLRDLAGVTLRSWTGAGSSLSVVWDGAVKGAVVPDGDYVIHLSGEDTSGHPFTSHMQTVTVDTIAPTVTSISVTPTSFSPRHGETTTISYTLSEESYVTIRIYNSAGKQVRTLTSNAHQLAGSQTIVWDGKDNGHHIVPAGTYTIRIYVEDKAGNTASPNPITRTVEVIE